MPSRQRLNKPLNMDACWLKRLKVSLTLSIEIKTFLSEQKCPSVKYKAYVIGPNEQQYFYLVESIKDNMVSGIISNVIRTVSGFQNGQRYEFSESEIYDWLITKPDGSEEGNYVGKY